MGLLDRFRRDAAGRAEQDGGPTGPPVPDGGPADAHEGSAEAGVAGNALTCVRLFADAWEIELDFTPASLEQVDEVLDGLHDEYRRSGAMPPADVLALVTDYLYEVARKQFGGEYIGGDEANPVLLKAGDDRSGVIVFGREKVVGRVRNGPEDSLPFFYEGIAPGLQRTGLTLLH